MEHLAVVIRFLSSKQEATNYAAIGCDDGAARDLTRGDRPVPVDLVERKTKSIGNCRLFFPSTRQERYGNVFQKFQSQQ